MKKEIQHTEALLREIKKTLNTQSSAGYNNAPIGIFDSGFGGLTVANEIIKSLPEESIIYLGDSGRCPYGPRSLGEVDLFVQQISAWLLKQKVKLIVIACNTATAAGLEHAAEVLPVPVIGVIDPGARAAVRKTKNNKVGVIATQATVESGAYTRAIRNIDPDITVFSTATPRFVDIAEQGIKMAQGPIETVTSSASKVYIRPAFQEIARDYLDPLRRCEIDTLVLGCTHFPLLKTLIGGIIGVDVMLVNSAHEAAKDAVYILQEGNIKAEPNHKPTYRFCTTGSDVKEFEEFGSRVLDFPLNKVEHVKLGDLCE